MNTTEIVNPQTCETAWPGRRIMNEGTSCVSVTSSTELFSLPMDFLTLVGVDIVGASEYSSRGMCRNSRP